MSEKGTTLEPGCHTMVAAEAAATRFRRGARCARPPITPAAVRVGTTPSQGNTTDPSLITSTGISVEGKVTVGALTGARVSSWEG